MNENEIARIAAAVNQLRPDWPTASLRTLITDKLGSRPRRDVAVALTWVACESATTTPARVLEAGPWWRAVGVEDGGVPPRPPKPHEACRDCGKHFDACLCEGGPTIRAVAPLPDAVAKVAHLRAIKADVDAELCGHGVARTSCTDKHAETEPSEGETDGE